VLTAVAIPTTAVADQHLEDNTVSVQIRSVAEHCDKLSGILF